MEVAGPIVFARELMVTIFGLDDSVGTFRRISESHERMIWSKEKITNVTVEFISSLFLQYHQRLILEHVSRS